LRVLSLLRVPTIFSCENQLAQKSALLRVFILLRSLLLRVPTVLHLLNAHFSVSDSLFWKACRLICLCKWFKNIPSLSPTSLCHHDSIHFCFHSHTSNREQPSSSCNTNTSTDVLSSSHVLISGYVLSSRHVLLVDDLY